MKNEAAVTLGKLAHKKQSAAQSEASRRNGRAGGRPRTKSPYAPAQSITQVNRAIQHLGVELVRGEDRFYFWSLDPASAQIGDSVPRAHLNQAGLARWLSDAEYAVKQHKEKMNNDND